jgi:hypothetical protein
MDNSTLEEAEWRAEFERFGEEQVRSSLHSGLFPEPKRQFAFRWLGDEAITRRLRESMSLGPSLLLWQRYSWGYWASW